MPLRRTAPSDVPREASPRLSCVGGSCIGRRRGGTAGQARAGRGAARPRRGGQRGRGGERQPAGAAGRPSVPPSVRPSIGRPAVKMRRSDWPPAGRLHARGGLSKNGRPTKKSPSREGRRHKNARLSVEGTRREQRTGCRTDSRRAGIHD